MLDDGQSNDIELVGICQDGWDVEVATNVLKKFLMATLLNIAIIEVAQVEFDVVVDQLVDTKNWSRDIADVEANIHVHVAVSVLVAMRLDVVHIGSSKLSSGIKSLRMDLRNRVDGRD